MMFWRKSAADRLIANAERFAKESKHASHLRLTLKADRSAVVLSTHIDDRDASWITYNREEMDRLIQMLQAYRNELR